MNFRGALQGKFARDSVWMLVSYSVVAFSGILLNFILGRRYGPDAVGVFNQAYSLFQIFAVVGAMGVNFSTIKHVAESRDDSHKVKSIFSASQAVTFIFSSLVAVIIIAVVSAFPSLSSSGNVRRATILITIALPFFVTNKNLWSYYIGFRRMREYSVFRLIRWVSVISIVFLWTVLKLPMVYAVLAFTLTDILMSVWLHVSNSDTWSAAMVSKEWIRTHLFFGFKSVLTEVFSSLYARLPIIIIGYYLGDEQAGMYSIAATMASGILIIASILQDNFNPVVANLHGTGNIEQLKEYVKKLRKFSWYSVIPLIAGSVIIYKVYILFLGSKYKDADVIFYIIMGGVGLSYIVSWAGGVLTMTGNQMMNLLRIVATLVLLVAGCVIMIPLAGVAGAAIAFSFSALVNLVMLYFIILVKVKVKIL